MGEPWHFGNAKVDGKDRRGWFIGYFLGESDGVRATDAIEVKWGSHPAGEGRPEWSTDEHHASLLLLISGRFRQDFADGSLILKEQGDYVIWGPGISHSWQAEEDSVVITVRWPSVPENAS
jgi:hypothetical protein